MMKRTSSAFTLIELLVVIAMIAILASMLLPALQNARISGHMAKCRGNQRGMSQAILLYASDFKDSLPFHLGLPITEGKNKGGGLNFDSVYWMRYAIKYYGVGKKLFICPGNPHNEVNDGKENFDIGIGPQGFNTHSASGDTFYSMNGRLLQPWQEYQAGKPSGMGKMTRMFSPGRSILILEYHLPTFQDSPKSITEGSLARFQADVTKIRDHNGHGSTFTMVDGHSETLKYASNPSELFCSNDPKLIVKNDWCNGALWYIKQIL